MRNYSATFWYITFLGFSLRWHLCCPFQEQLKLTSLTVTFSSLSDLSYLMDLSCHHSLSSPGGGGAALHFKWIDRKVFIKLPMYPLCLYIYQIVSPQRSGAKLLTHIHSSKFSAVSRLVYPHEDDEEGLEDFSSIISNATAEFYRLTLRISWMVSSFSLEYVIHLERNAG